VLRAIVPKQSTPSIKPSSAVCPYCALLCDDLSVAENADHSVRVIRNGCKRATHGFQRAPLAPGATILGRMVTHDAAVAAAAGLLKRARVPLFAGLGTDVDGMRALVDFAEQRRAIVDHMHGDALNAVSRVLQTRGWYATTLSEVRNRADMVVVIDVDMNTRYENFARRCLTPKAQLRPGKKQPRKVAYVGQRRHESATLAADQSIHCRADARHDIALALLANLRGQRIDKRRAGGVDSGAIAKLAESMRAARYCALVFAPAALGAEKEPLIGTLCDIVDELNRNTRAAILPLGGDDGGQTAVSTCSWLTGYPLRTTFAKTLRYEPQTNRTLSLLSANAVDALLWVDAFGHQSTPPANASPTQTIVLAATRPAHSDRYAVFIPVGTPGVDHFARLVRTDAVVTLPLTQQRSSELPSVADVVTQMLRAP
jgi:formylmethanofuran dehydrogenase subunit B